jgi:hypothetical protein
MLPTLNNDVTFFFFSFFRFAKLDICNLLCKNSHNKHFIKSYVSLIKRERGEGLFVGEMTNFFSNTFTKNLLRKQEWSKIVSRAFLFFLLFFIKVSLLRNDWHTTIVQLCITIISHSFTYSQAITWAAPHEVVVTKRRGSARIQQTNHRPNTSRN